MTDATEMPVVSFPFEVEYPFAHVSRAFGVLRPEQARLELHGDRLVAVFGPWRVRTTLDNVAAVHVTGPYAAWKVIGPPHVSFADGGLTFATTTAGGVCLELREPVSGLLPFGVVRHRSLTATVRDPAHVAEVIERARLVDARAPEGEAEERLAQVAHDALAGATAAELRAQAEQRGIEDASSLSKQELLERLQVGVDHAGERVDGRDDERS